MKTEEFTSSTFRTVDKCLAKAEKVVVSLIVDREDNLETRAKAEVANAMIKLKYMNNPRVLVCNHDNLRDRKYRQRRDELHLTEAGTSRLANNLKYKIAKSLDIQVIKKRSNEYRNGYEHDNNERRDYKANRGHREQDDAEFSRYGGFQSYSQGGQHWNIR